MYLGMQSSVTQQLKGGLLSQWGAFAGEGNGYAIINGSAADVHALTLGWFPLCPV